MARRRPDTLGSVTYKQASAIRPLERDHKLHVARDEWPATPLNGWQSSRGGFTRIVTSDHPQAPKAVKLKVDVHETILRFPSAPVHGLQRHDEHHHPVPSQPFHTLRLLRSADQANREGRTTERRANTRYFLMHTGLVTVHGVGPGRSGWADQRGDRLAVEVGGDRGGEVVVCRRRPCRRQVSRAVRSRSTRRSPWSVWVP